MIYKSEIITDHVQNTNILSLIIKKNSLCLLSILENKSNDPMDHSIYFNLAKKQEWLKSVLQELLIIPSSHFSNIQTYLVQKLIPNAPDSYIQQQLTDSLTSCYGNMKQFCNNEYEDILKYRPMNNIQKDHQKGLYLKSHILGILHNYMEKDEKIHYSKEPFIYKMRLNRNHLNQEVQDIIYYKDIVCTPMGYGEVKGFRKKDHFVTVLFPWGIGTIHINDIISKKEAENRYNNLKNT